MEDQRKPIPGLPSGLPPSFLCCPASCLTGASPVVFTPVAGGWLGHCCGCLQGGTEGTREGTQRRASPWCSCHSLTVNKPDHWSK